MIGAIDVFCRVLQSAAERAGSVRCSLVSIQPADQESGAGERCAGICIICQIICTRVLWLDFSLMAGLLLSMLSDPGPD